MEGGVIVWRRLVLRWDWEARAWRMRGLRKTYFDCTGPTHEPTR